jgi:hypothetical protein
MLIQGSIKRFNLVAVLQFLAMNQATGVLEVRDFEEYGFIYLVEGRVEGISLPLTDQRLGNRLVAAGFLTERQLSEALLVNSALSHDEKRRTPLGQRLIDMGFTTEQAIREVLEKQTLEQVFELAHWSDGVFLYTEPEEMPVFQLTIQADVQGLLLDAQRRIDEGQQARKRRDPTGEEICFSCPCVRECDEAHREKYLKTDVCLWRQMSAVVDERVGVGGDGVGLSRTGQETAHCRLDASIDWD